jgi:hypothetical protein
MERPLTEHDTTEDAAANVNSGWVNGVSTLVTQRVGWTMTSQQALPAGDVACEGLHLALIALHIDIAWHAGVISTETAMEGLHREIGRTINLCDQSARTGSLELADRPQSDSASMRHRTSCS